MKNRNKKLKHLEYKHYVGSLEYDAKTKLYSGQVKLIPTFLHYVAHSRLEAEVMFRAKVDDYITNFHRFDRNITKQCRDYRNLFD